MLAGFPDYGKTSAEYVPAITAVMESYPITVQERLSDFRTGIPARCKFLPTIAEIVELGDEILRSIARSRPKPILIEVKQDPAERARIGEKMAELAAELAKVNVIEPVAPKEPYRKPAMSRAAIQADLDAIRARNTPERLAAIEAATLAQDQEALEKALAS